MIKHNHAGCVQVPCLYKPGGIGSPNHGANPPVTGIVPFMQGLGS